MFRHYRPWAANRPADVRFGAHCGLQSDIAPCPTSRSMLFVRGLEPILRRMDFALVNEVIVSRLDFSNSD